MEFFKKNMIAIFSALSLVTLFLPILTITTSTESEWVDTAATASKTVSGFSAATGAILGYLLLIGPVLLIVMNYVKQLEQYKGQLAIAVPVVCLVALVIVFFQAKGETAAASGGNEYFSVESSATVGIGLFVTAAAHIATAVAGAVTFHGLKLDKNLLGQIKSGSAELLGNVKTGGAELLGNVKAGGAELLNNVKAGGAELVDGAKQAAANRTAEGGAAPAHTAKKPTNIQHTEDILSLIRKLAAMKDEGILTEEEFVEKKRDLLAEIK